MEDIIIERRGNHSFNVRQGDKYSEEVTFEEMIGLVAALTIRTPSHCLGWMKTKEQHDAWRQSIKTKAAEIKSNRE